MLFARTICPVLLLLFLFAAACQERPVGPAQPQPSPTPLAASATAVAAVDGDDSAEIPPAATQLPTAPQATATPASSGTLAPSPTPFVIQNPSPPCGQLLPLVVDEAINSAEFNWQVPPLSEELIPSEVIPALEWLFEHPDRVSIVAYQVGYEGIGFYHNPDQPRPLASVNKLVHLTAFANAIDSGTLDPDGRVKQADLDAFYLPGSDLGAHPKALRSINLDEMTLDDVMRIMIRYSDNAAPDYLQYELGQRTIEQTVLDLGMQNHSAVCPYIGRFLAMGSHESRNDNRNTINRYINSPNFYGEQVMALSDRYLQDPVFRSSAQGYWDGFRNPSVNDQAYFVNALETRGTARDYATLMRRIALGEIGSPAANDRIRGYLRWPLSVFPSNQERYSDIGYKNGTFPGVLNATYFATRVDESLPMVVTLFFEDLPNRTYQTWRRDLPHDALAHWLLTNPNAIHILHILRDSATP